MQLWGTFVKQIAPRCRRVARLRPRAAGRFHFLILTKGGIKVTFLNISTQCDRNLQAPPLNSVTLLKRRSNFVKIHKNSARFVCRFYYLWKSSVSTSIQT